MWECLRCGEEIEDDFDVCWNCQAGRDGSLPESPSPPKERKLKPEKKVKARDSREVTSLMNRYSDAYIIARVTDGWGKLIKIFGIVVAIILILVGFLSIGDSSLGSANTAVGIGAIVVGVIIGIWFYIVGVIISAQGQILKASLDSAVNNSPFLTNEQRAKIMSL